VKITKYTLLLSSLCSILVLKQSFALTGGPMMPEAASFATVNMDSGSYVDLPTGNFQWNLPVMNIPGRGGLDFTLNLSYAAGIKLDQDASWVGLGWNVSPGAIFRTVRNIPDDYSGKILKTRVQGSGSTYSVGALGFNYNWTTGAGGKTNRHAGISFSVSGLADFLTGFLGGQWWWKDYQKDYPVYGFMHFEDPSSMGGWDEACDQNCMKREHQPYDQRPGTMGVLGASPAMDNYMVTGPGPSGSIMPWRPAYTLKEHNDNAISGTARFFFTDYLGGSQDPTVSGLEPAVKIEHHFRTDAGDYYGLIDSMIITDSNGTKYVYGQPAYVKESGDMGWDGGNNKTRHVLSKPYAYAWYLTAILGPDYVNYNGNTYADVPGNPAAGYLPYPDDGDYGNWIRFDYQLYADSFTFADPYVDWRETPLIQDYSVKTRSWGTKEILYLSKITTPTHEADFAISTQTMSGFEANASYDNPGTAKVCTFGGNGLPGWECVGGEGIVDATAKLDSVSLYSRFPSKTYSGGASFTYDYSVRKNSLNSAPDLFFGGRAGALTLKELKLLDSTGNGDQIKYSFQYITHNPSGQEYLYDMRKWDRWGYYKRNGAWGIHANTNVCTETEGCDTAAWSLKEIGLPLGGKIGIEYGIDSFRFHYEYYTSFLEYYMYGGGLTVNKLTFDDGLGKQHVRRFYYRTGNKIAEPFQLTWTSGVLGVNVPPPFEDWSEDGETVVLNGIQNPYSNSDVHYSRVFEFTDPDGGLTISDFTTGALEQYSNYNATGFPSYTLDETLSSCPGSQGNWNCHLHDRSYAWEKLRARNMYDRSTGELVYSETYEFNDFYRRMETNFRDEVTASTNAFHNIHYLFWGNLEVKNKTVKNGIYTTYDSNKIPTEHAATKFHEYAYNEANGLLTREKISDVTGKTIIKTTEYCAKGNACGNTNSGLTGEVLQSRNIISLPYKNETKEDSLTNSKSISYSYNQYLVESDGLAATSANYPKMRLYPKALYNWLDSDGDKIVEPSDQYIGSIKTAVDKYGNVLSENDPLGVTANIVYQASLASAVPSSFTKAGFTKSYLYEDPRFLKPTRVDNPDGSWDKFQFDSYGRLTKNESSSGSIKNYQYHVEDIPSSGSLNWIKTSTSASGTTRISKNYFDGLGRKVMDGNHTGNSWILSQDFFDDTGRLERKYEPRLSSTELYEIPTGVLYSKNTYYSDPSNRLFETFLSCQDETCHYERTTNEYLSDGASELITEITDPTAAFTKHPVKTRTSTHILGLDSTQTRSEKSTVTLNDPTEKTTTIIDASGKSMQIFKDSLDRKIATLKPDMIPFSAISYPWLGQVTEEFAYDAVGNVVLYRDSNLAHSSPPKHIVFTYDSLGRKTAKAINTDTGAYVTDTWSGFAWDNYSASFCDNGAGTMITSPRRTDMTEFTSRAKEKLSCIAEPGFLRTILFYDNSGRLGEKHVIYGQGGTDYVFEYYYNELGEITKETIDPVNKIYASYRMNALGQIAFVDLIKGSATPVEVAALTYLPNGKINTITRTVNGVQTTYDYDDFKRLDLIQTSGTAFISPLGFNRFLKYDSLGRITEIYNGTDDSVPNNRIGTFNTIDSYDTFGRLLKGTVNSLLTPSLARNFVYTYDNTGNRLTALEQQGIENVSNDTYAYLTNTNRLNRFTHQDGSYDQFEYDFNGNITAATNSLGSALAYQYDLLGDLAGVSFPDLKTETYIYDSNGRRIKKTDRNGTYSYYFYNGQSTVFDRRSKTIIIGDITEDQEAVYAVNKIGGSAPSIIPSTPSLSDSITTLDVVSLLDFVAKSGTAPTNTLAADINSDAKVSIEDVASLADNLLASKKPHGPTTRTVLVDTAYLSVAGIKILSIENGNTANPRYYLSDHLGSSSVVLDASGREIGREEYYPFGSALNISGVKPTYTFTGKEQDSTTGLYYMNARYYNPVIGRFMARDTFDSGPNPYAYANNNPLITTDPTGHSGESTNNEPVGFTSGRGTFDNPIVLDLTITVVGQSNVAAQDHTYVDPSYIENQVEESIRKNVLARRRFATIGAAKPRTQRSNNNLWYQPPGDYLGQGVNGVIYFDGVPYQTTPMGAVTPAGAVLFAATGVTKAIVEKDYKMIPVNIGLALIEAPAAHFALASYEQTSALNHAIGEHQILTPEIDLRAPVWGGDGSRITFKPIDWSKLQTQKLDSIYMFIKK
jgi:RHS repeat-associated protein